MYYRVEKSSSDYFNGDLIKAYPQLSEHVFKGEKAYYIEGNSLDEVISLLLGLKLETSDCTVYEVVVHEVNPDTIEFNEKFIIEVYDDWRE